MTKLEQAARQLVTNWDSGLTIHDELDALREALAEQAEQSQLADASLEPVAWMNEERNTITWNQLYPNMTPLYTAPVRTKDLTDGEVLDVFEKAACHETYRMLEGCRAVIAADRAKNNLCERTK